MTTASTFQEYRLYFNTEDTVSFFARHIGDAIEQLADFVGESFTVACVREIRVSTPNGWETVKLPNGHVIN